MYSQVDTGEADRQEFSCILHVKACQVEIKANR